MDHGSGGLKVELWDIDKVIPYELNAKLHDAKQVKRIVQSIKEFGWNNPIVVDKNGVIIAGHGRRLAAISLEMKKVPVIVRRDLDEQQVRALRLADNRVAISGMDGEKLQEELASLQIDLEGIFDAKELQFLEADLSIVDDSKFVADIEAAVEQQNAETHEKIATVDDKDVPIAKALGFKSIKTRHEKHIAAFIAEIEERTGKQGADAFVAFCESFA